MRRLILTALPALALALGCDPGEPPGDGGPDAEIRNGCLALREPQARPGDDLGGDTYASFARPFFDTYCVRCHSSTLVTTEERSFAPSGLDWDDEATIRAALPEIRNAAGVVNFMPPSEPTPSCEERVRLVRWIDAAAP